jgi:hypothetical protein
MKSKYGPGGEFEPDWYVVPLKISYRILTFGTSGNLQEAMGLILPNPLGRILRSMSLLKSL